MVPAALVDLGDGKTTSDGLGRVGLWGPERAIRPAGRLTRVRKASERLPPRFCSRPTYLTRMRAHSALPAHDKELIGIAV